MTLYSSRLKTVDSEPEFVDDEPEFVLETDVSTDWIAEKYSDINPYYQRLYDFYKRYAPGKLRKLDIPTDAMNTNDERQRLNIQSHLEREPWITQMLTSFRGREEQMMKHLRARYGPENPQYASNTWRWRYTERMARTPLLQAGGPALAAAGHKIETEEYTMRMKELLVPFINESFDLDSAFKKGEMKIYEKEAKQASTTQHMARFNTKINNYSTRRGQLFIPTRTTMTKTSIAPVPTPQQHYDYSPSAGHVHHRQRQYMIATEDEHRTDILSEYVEGMKNIARWHHGEMNNILSRPMVIEPISAVLPMDPHLAATRIQSNYRGHQTRKRLHLQKQQQTVQPEALKRTNSDVYIAQSQQRVEHIIEL